MRNNKFNSNRNLILFLVFIIYPKEAIKDYFTRCISFGRMGLKWVTFTIIFFLIIVMVGLFISVNILKMEMPGMLWVKMIIARPYIIPVFLILSFVSGPLNEEFGWRGYSLDRLLIRFGYVKASLLLGFIWAIWHIAWYFTPGQVQYDLLQNSLLDAFMFVPSTIALSFVVSFVYINTNRSILAGAFVHMMSNFITGQLLSPYSVDVSSIIRCVYITFCCIIIIYAINSKKFKFITNNVIDDIDYECQKYS
jgi:membrane protease YdiL (CAAX protease family)